MGYIFLDESGDLGFDFSKKRTTSFFIITVFYVKNKRNVERVVKTVFKELFKKHKHKSGVLHANKENKITRKKLLSKLNELDIKVMVIYLNKNKVYTKLQNEKNILYNYVTNILLDRIYSKKLVPVNQHINLIASRKETNKFLNNNFRAYLSNQVSSNHSLDIEINIKTPYEEKGLQAADFLSWAVFRKYEYSDDSYYKLFRAKIVEENGLFV